MCLKRKSCLALLAIYQERGTNHKGEQGGLQRDQTHITRLKITQVPSIPTHLEKATQSWNFYLHLLDIPETGRN